MNALSRVSLDLPDAWRTRALVLVHGEVDRDWFTPDELAIAETFRLEKRRREWLLSRCAAKALAMQRGLCADPREFVTAQAANVSISHSAPYAAAAIDERPIGIDIQVVRELKESAAHLFLSDDEIDAMERVSIPNRLIHFWTAKEAAWKQLGGAVETLKKVSLMLDRETRDSLIFDRVETLRVDDVVIALTR